MVGFEEFVPFRDHLSVQTAVSRIIVSKLRYMYNYDQFDMYLSVRVLKPGMAMFGIYYIVPRLREYMVRTGHGK